MALMSKIEIMEALKSFISAKIDTVSIPSWKTIAPTYQEAIQKIFNLLNEKGLIKKSNFNSLFFGEDKFFEEDLNSENNNLLTFKGVKLVEWGIYQPSLELCYDKDFRSHPERKILDVFSFLYIFLENPNLFEGIKDVFNLQNGFSSNYIDIFFPRKQGEDKAKIFTIAWHWDEERNWACLENCKLRDSLFSLNEAYALIVNVG